MNDGRSPENQDSRSWFDRLASVISGEAENKPELIDELRDAKERGLFNHETLAILEGALAVSDMQVLFRLLTRTANDDAVPTWTPGDEFEKLR